MNCIAQIHHRSVVMQRTVHAYNARENTFTEFLMGLFAFALVVAAIVILGVMVYLFVEWLFTPTKPPSCPYCNHALHPVLVQDLASPFSANTKWWCGNQECAGSEFGAPGSDEKPVPIAEL